MSKYDEGFKAEQEDFAISAGRAPADETLSKPYREGYSAGYFQASKDFEDFENNQVDIIELDFEDYGVDSYEL